MHYGVCRLASLSRPRGENVAHIVEQTSLMRIIIELNSNGPDRSRVHYNAGAVLKQRLA